jgi:hypothetical protein
VNVAADAGSPGLPILVVGRVELTAQRLLGLIVAVSVAGRLLAVWVRSAPLLLPDEYLYAELSRSISETGRPLVRGVSGQFPALLEPIVLAPTWLAGDVATSYRLGQVIAALAMSLAAVPAFLIARKIGVGSRLGLLAALFTVAVPDMLYAESLLTEAFAYPLFLTAILAGMVAIERPSRRTQALFLLSAGALVFTRTQFVFLPLAFLVAAAVTGLREGGFRAALREQTLPIVAFVVPAGLAAALLGDRLLGVYAPVFSLRVGLGDLVSALVNESTVFVYAAGWVIVPAALVGFALALARPRSRPELAFAALAVSAAPPLLVEAAVYGPPTRIHERYTFYLAPLVAAAFALCASRGWPGRTVHGLLSLGLVALAFAVPLTGFAVGDGKDNSPFLGAALWVLEETGSPAGGSFLIAIVAAVASGFAALAAFRPRVATVVSAALALAVCGASSAVAARHDAEMSARLRAGLGANPSWVDDMQLGSVSLVWTLGSIRTEAVEDLFWNRSIDHVLLAPGAPLLDPFPSTRLRIADDGTLLAAGKPLGGPLLVSESVELIRFANARLLSARKPYKLWQTDGPARVRLVMVGRWHDGWLASGGEIGVWPDRGERALAGVLTFQVTDPSFARDAVLRFEEDARTGGAVHSFRLTKGATRTVRVPVCTAGPWHARFGLDFKAYAGSRVVTVHTTEPRVVADASACPATSR